jgi:hypothetical protein
MSIDFNRICKLAGLASSNKSVGMSRQLNESYVGEGEGENETDEPVMEEYVDEEVESELDSELVEIDMGELMSEIRRAKRIMKNNKIKKQKLKETHLKRIIQKEVESVLSEIEDRDSNWVYGKRQPKRSRRGYSAQGSYLPGIGFK